MAGHAGQTARAEPAQQQTTHESAGPFIRRAQPGKRVMYDQTNVPFTQSAITAPLTGVTGYFARFRILVAATGGVNGTNTVTALADAPFSNFSQVLLKDAYGTPLISADGYTALYLIPMFSGGFGIGSANDITNLPSWTGVSTGASGTGNFNFRTAFPLEFTKGYGVISGGNANLLPTLTWTQAGSASVYGVAPGTLPVLEVKVAADFYWQPAAGDPSRTKSADAGAGALPPGYGSTRQWVQQSGNPPVTSAGNQMVTLPRLGGFIDVFILVARNASNARADIWGNFINWIVDGIPLIECDLQELEDDIWIQYRIARPLGVLVFTRRTSLSQEVLGLLDSLETVLATSPGTQVQIQCLPWATVSGGPFQIEVCAGQIVPSQALIQGLPEV